MLESRVEKWQIDVRMKAGNLHIDAVKVTPSGVKSSSTGCCCCGGKATYFVTDVNPKGKTSSKAFCILHAIKEGLLHPKAFDLLGGGNTLHKPAELACKCGCTVSTIKAKGRVGCASCYKVFGALLRPYIQQVQPGNVHCGKAPRKSTAVVSVRRRITQLEQRMQEAIREENYEMAALARDEIKVLSAK